MLYIAEYWQTSGKSQIDRIFVDEDTYYPM